MKWMRAGTGARLLLTISSLFAISTLATMAVTIENDRVGTIRDAEHKSAMLAQVLEEQARRAFDISRAALLELGGAVMLSGPPTVTPAVANRMDAWMRDIPQIQSFWLIDANGRVLFSTQPGASPGIDASDREYFSALRNAGDFHVGPLTLGRINKAWFFSLSKRLVDRDGRFVGVLVASMRADYFTSLYDRLGLGDNDNITIYRSDGAVVARRLSNWDGETPPSGAGHALFTDLLPKAATGEFEGVSPIDHMLRLCAYRAVAGWPLVVLANSDKGQVLAPWRLRAWRIGGFGAVVLASLGFLTWWGYRRVSGEAHALAVASATATRNAILINEVHHRVKNNLAIIQSLLMLEANLVAPEARQGYQHSISRVEAMGLVHDLLYQSQDFEGVDGGTYLRRLADGLAATSCANLSIVTEVDAIPIDLDTAIPLALIVNEVVVNVAEHGFPNGAAGRVIIRLEGKGDACTLTVEDDGIGSPEGVEPGRLRGLGLVLVGQLARQLGGEWSMQGGAETVFTLIFPRKKF